MSTRDPADYSIMMSVADAILVDRRISELEAGMREIRAAAVRVGDGETREALEHCADTAMEVTTRVLRDLEHGERLGAEFERVWDQNAEKLYER